MTENKRHIHYINPAIQNRLVFSFIVFEVVLLVLVLYVFYLDINGIIENNLYRVHINKTENFEFFLIHLFKVVCVLFVVNIFAASIAVWWWQRYVNSIVEPLERYVRAINILDLNSDIDVSLKHDVLIYMGEWYSRERQKYQRIRELMMKILAKSDSQDYKHNVDLLDKMSAELKFK